METPSQGLNTRDLLYAGGVILACVGAALLLHVGAGPEAPDNPGAAAQLAAAAAQHDGAAVSTAREAE